MGAVDVGQPQNLVSGQSGMFYLTANPLSWGDKYTFAGGEPPAAETFPTVVPFYVPSTDEVLVGYPVSWGE